MSSFRLAIMCTFHPALPTELKWRDKENIYTKKKKKNMRGEEYSISNDYIKPPSLYLFINEALDCVF